MLLRAHFASQNSNNSNSNNNDNDNDNNNNNTNNKLLVTFAVLFVANASWYHAQQHRIMMIFLLNRKIK